MRPLVTKLLWDGKPMTAEREYEIECRTAGAQPTAVVSWWINGDIRLKSQKNQVRPAKSSFRLGVKTWKRGSTACAFGL